MRIELLFSIEPVLFLPPFWRFSDKFIDSLLRLAPFDERLELRPTSKADAEDWFTSKG